MVAYMVYMAIIAEGKSSWCRMICHLIKSYFLGLVVKMKRKHRESQDFYNPSEVCDQ